MSSSKVQEMEIDLKTADVYKQWCGTTEIPNGAHLSFRWLAKGIPDIKHPDHRIDMLKQGVTNKTLCIWMSQAPGDDAKSKLTTAQMIALTKEQKEPMKAFLLEHFVPGTTVFSFLHQRGLPSSIYRFKIRAECQLVPTTITEAIHRMTHDDTATWEKWLMSFADAPQYDIYQIIDAYRNVEINMEGRDCLFEVVRGAEIIFQCGITRWDKCATCGQKTSVGERHVCQICSLQVFCSPQCLTQHHQTANKEEETNDHTFHKKQILPNLFGGDSRCLHCNKVGDVKSPCTVRCSRCGLAVYCSQEHCELDKKSFHTQECQILVPPPGHIV
jgi:hypothetical protein